MNIFNKTIAVLVFLVLIAAAIGALMALFGFVLNIPGGLFQQQLATLQGLSGWQRVTAIIAAILFIALMVGLIRLESIRPRREKTIVVRDSERGIISVNRESVERFAERVGTAESAQVRYMRCTVKEHPDGLNVRCDPVLRVGTNVATLTPRIQNRVKEAIEQLLGLTVRDIQVRARYESTGKKPVQHELVEGNNGR